MARRSRGGRLFLSVSLTVALAVAALAHDARAAAPPAGMPVQLSPPNACYSTTAAGGCAAFGEGQAIAGAEPIAISGDGLNIYAGGDNGGGVAFSRGSGGALNTIGSAGGFADTAFATSGAGLFAGLRDSGSSNGAVQAFARGAGGTLSFVNEVADGCPVSTAHCATNNGLYEVQGVAVAPNGEHVYAASHLGGGGTTGGALTAFSRNPATQTIAQLQCVPRTSTAAGFCHEGSGLPSLEGADSLAVSPDNKFLYATGYFAGSVVGFNIVQSGPNAGKIGSLVNCLWGSPSAGECVQASGMSAAKGIALSPDGRDAYVAMFNGGVTALSRDPVSGVLSFNQCFTQGGGSGCAADPTLVVGARDVVVSPDGSDVYVTGGSGVNGYLRAYARNKLTGQLAPIGCVTYLAIPGCSTAAGMANADKLAVSPDGHSLYVTAFEGGDGNGAVAAFRIQTAPSCQGASIGVAAGSSVSIPLACTDEGGDPITRRIVSAPGRGTLGEVNQAANTVTYTPAAGFTGRDSLVFAATDGTNESAPATVALAVTPPTITVPLPPIVVAGPHSRILGLGRRVRAAKLRSFHGTASGDRSVARVEVALERLIAGAHASATRHGSKARCLQLGSKRRLVALRVTHGRCAAPRFLLARGTSKWTFRLPGALPTGSYVLTSRATDAAGAHESSFSTRLGNRVSFTVY